MRSTAFVAFASFLMFAMFHSAAAESPTGGDGPTGVVQAGNEFALDLIRELDKENSGKNVFFSPESVSIALAMTAAGARGDTETQMAKVLHLGDKLADAHAAYRKLLARWNGDGQERGYELHVANRLWGQKSYPFLPSYLDLTRQQYGAEMGLMDFVHAPEAARKEINDWVQKQTADKIVDLMPSGSIDNQTCLVLTNAIYFKADWVAQFKKNASRNEDFFVSAGQNVQTMLMHQQARFAYAEDDTLQALELPYQGNDLSMIVLLPKTVDGLAAVEQSLTAEQIAAWRGKLQPQVVVLTLPKFKLDTSYSLAPTLGALGMKLAFTSSADFSAMDGQRDLAVSAVVHKAYVSVDEQGTEAAAATGVAVAGSAMPRPAIKPIIFRADHPFLFMICDKQDGGILFLGRMISPKG